LSRKITAYTNNGIHSTTRTIRRDWGYPIGTGKIINHCMWIFFPQSGE